MGILYVHSNLRRGAQCRSNLPILFFCPLCLQKNKNRDIRRPAKGLGGTRDIALKIGTIPQKRDRWQPQVICQSWVSHAWAILVISGLYAGQIWVVRVTCGSTMGYIGHMVHVRVTQGSYIGHMGHIWVMMWGSPMGHIGFLWVIRVNNGSRICHKWVNNGSYMGQNHMSHMSYMNQP